MNNGNWHETATFAKTLIAIIFSISVVVVGITVYVANIKEKGSLTEQRLSIEISRATKADERHDREIKEVAQNSRTERRIILTKLEALMEKAMNKMDAIKVNGSRK